MATVRTRFAPSPTGYMHIGGMRTALFNWLWARHNGGTFILRIDDTDQQRNIDEALGPILRAFKWLGLNWDEGPEVGGPFAPYFQSQRGELYRAAADRLLREGKAYRCFETKEQIEQDRKLAEAEKRQYVSQRRSLELSEAAIQQFVAEAKPHVVRLLVPRDQKVVIQDHIRDRVEWDAALIPDPVIMRSDGSPLYNFATVIDDAHMQITHVIRAEEHLSNTPIQVLLHQALGHTLPEFAHIPYVAAPGSKEKLSKRKLEQYRKNVAFKRMCDKGDAVFPQIGLGGCGGLDPVMVEYYERVGFLPAGVLNGLLRLGWSLDDKSEIFSLDDAVKQFTLDRVIKAPAGFDPDKLLSYQQHWMTQLSLDEKVAGCLPYLVKAGLIVGQVSSLPSQEGQVENVPLETREFVTRLITALGDRIKLFSDILDNAYFFREEVVYDEKEFSKRVAKEGVAALLSGYRDRIAELPEWSVETLEAALKSHCEANGQSPGTLIHALRISTTGVPIGPGVYECLLLVGKARSLRRIEAAVQRVTG